MSTGVLSPQPKGFLFRGRRYVRQPQPIAYPTLAPKARPPELERNRIALARWLESELGRRGAIASDTTVYYRPTTARERVQPDVMFKFGEPWHGAVFKVWERAAPEVAVELVGEKGARRKLHGNGAAVERLARRYARAGVRELVVFDPANRERPLRIWDLADFEQRERELVEGAPIACGPLGVFWVVREVDGGLVLGLTFAPA